MMGDCVAIIPARGGSKGIPGKNTLLVAGKPLVAWSIEHALHSSKIDSVWVTSDSAAILEIAQEYGARTILRPDNISGDKATSEEAWIHAVNHIKQSVEVELVVCIQPTSPVRGRHDLDEAIDKYYNQKFDSLLSVTQVEIILSGAWVSAARNQSIMITVTVSAGRISKLNIWRTAHFISLRQSSLSKIIIA